MNKRIALVHFLPLEKYPPAMNLIRTLEQTSFAGQVRIFSMEEPLPGIPRFTTSDPRFHFHRTSFEHGKRSWVRLLKTGWFYLSTLMWMLLYRPHVVMYVESLSAIPARIYGWLTGWKVKLLIHYHEYTSPKEFMEAPWLIRFTYQVDQQVWKHASWISHTHTLRLAQFNLDHPDQVPVPALKVVPNYPPRAWQQVVHKEKHAPKRKLVYVGVLGLDTMYLEEITTWLINEGRDFTLDIYAVQVQPAARDFLNALDTDRVTLHPGVSYFELPGILSQYDIGLILYKGHIQNYVMIAPNKLFEYLACGLEVWLPIQMEGSRSYLTSQSQPRVLALNFEALNQETSLIVSDTSHLPYHNPAYICEEALIPLIQSLTS